MSLKMFLSSLLPSFERARILEDIDSLSSDIGNNLSPAYSSAAQITKAHKFKSQVGQSTESMFHLRFPQERQTNHVAYIAGVLGNTEAVLKVADGMVSEVFARDVTKDALTYKKAALLQYLSVVRFVNDFAGRHLLRLLAAEDAATKGQPEEAGLPVDQRFFKENLEPFLHALKVLDLRPREFSDRLAKMQDLQIVADKISTIASTLGPENVDPLRMGFIGPNATSSLIYKLRTGLANYQVATHNQNKELSKALQLRLYALKDAHSGKSDPKLQQQIEYTEARLARLREEMSGFEEKYG